MSERDLPSRSALAQTVDQALDQYFELLEGDMPIKLHRLFMGEVEEALLRHVLARCDGNQSLAAAMLGINRGTLRKKLLQYGLVD